MSDTLNPGERGRFSSQRKTAMVLRLVRGEDLESIRQGVGAVQFGRFDRGIAPGTGGYVTTVAAPPGAMTCNTS